MLLYFVVAVVGSVILGCLLGWRLSRRSGENTLGNGLLRRRPRLWVGLVAIVVISCVGVWAISQDHVVLGVGVLVAAYALQLAVLQVLKAKNRGQQ